MKVNEIFYSLQGEGLRSGQASVFVRLSGCNLRCPFCDTDHQSGSEMTVDEVVSAVCRYPARWVVVTGGEPSLQLDASLVDALHRRERLVAVETNGTRPLPAGVDWVTLSPKAAPVVLDAADELKVVYDGTGEPDRFDAIEVRRARLVQPCDVGDPVRNAAIVAAAVDFVKRHPEWRLSLQTHKLIGIK